MMNNSKKIYALNELGYEGMDVKVMPVFKYDETTANVDYLTDFMKYVRTNYQIMLGHSVQDPERLGCANWWFNRFVGSRSGRPMRLTPSYIAKKYGVVAKIKDFDKLRALEQFSSYPGLADRTHSKLDEGIIFKGFEMPFEAAYMAANPSDIDGIRTNGICLDMMLKSLNETYDSLIKKRNWENVEDLLTAYQKQYPGFTFFKKGMNVVEQTLAHLDSAGYYIASILDANKDRISGALSVYDDYVCSFDFRDKLEHKYGIQKVAHYFDDLLISRENAHEQKMCYFVK